MTDHLPDCDDYAFSGAGFHPNCERICICRQVRRVEDRVLKEAREAVAAILPHHGKHDGWVMRDEPIAAIDALQREKP